MIISTIGYRQKNTLKIDFIRFNPDKYRIKKNPNLETRLHVLGDTNQIKRIDDNNNIMEILYLYIIQTNLNYI